MTATDRRTRLLDILVQQSLRFGSFKLASGQMSDYYIDGKLTSLHPEGVNLIAREMIDLLAGQSIDAVGGVTLGGDPIVGAIAAISHEVGTPHRAFIIRKESKGHGTGKMIEGLELDGNHSVAVIEDVVSTGGSALRAIESVRATGARIAMVLTVVDRQMGAEDAFREAGLEYRFLFTRDELLARAEALGLRPSAST